MARTVDDVRQLLAAALPAWADAPVTALGEGLDHAAFLAGGELVVRFGDGVAGEAALLELAAARCPLAVPEPLLVDDEGGALAYRLVPGTPLLDVPPARRAERAAAIGRALRAVLHALQATPAADARAVAEVDDTPPADWLDEVAETYADVREALTEPQRAAVERFLAQPPPAAPGRDALAFTHNDLGIEHVLADPATCAPTGIIDWSDAAIADPAADLGRLLRDLGEDALAAALEPAAGAGAAGLAERARFYARCLTLEDLAFGLETRDDRYVAKSVAGLDRLF